VARQRTPRTWPEITVDSWLLGAEAWMVIGLRTARILKGGPAACREARLMVTEKVESSARLASALAEGRLGSSVRSVADGTVSHYLEGVRANRKRLSRGWRP
jgi:hypothetical protein